MASLDSTMTMDDPAYARAGVDQSIADDAVAAIVKGLATIKLSRPSRQLLKSGHFANIIELTPEVGVALSTDGVGTKLVIAERLERFDTVGIDCIAMNVNDVICVGAEPLAMLDYIGIERADPQVCEQIAIGLARGSEEACIEIPGGELAQLGDVIKGFDLVGACFGVVAPDKIIAGDAVSPGDPVIGLPSRGLHANGYTLARKALKDIALDSDPDGLLGRSLGDELLEPTAIYVRPVLELLRSGASVHGLAHITSDGLDNLLRLNTSVSYRIDDELPVPEIFRLIEERGSVSEAEMYKVFNMGCGFCCIVSPESEASALQVLRRHHGEAKRIGEVVSLETTGGKPRVIRTEAQG
jgi:phosphoribosylformylglycinamidine cyclo-ligase